MRGQWDGHLEQAGQIKRRLVERLGPRLSAAVDTAFHGRQVSYAYKSSDEAHLEATVQWIDAAHELLLDPRPQVDNPVDNSSPLLAEAALKRYPPSMAVEDIEGTDRFVDDEWGYDEAQRAAFIAGAQWALSREPGVPPVG